MPLLPNNLTAAFVRVLQAGGQAAQAARNLSQAYEDYARAGTAGGVPPTLVGMERPRLEAALRAALEVNRAPTPLILAQAWAIGLTAFWAGVVFGAGGATGLPGVVVMVPALVAGLANPLNTVQSAATIMATGIDACTRTLVVIIGGTPVPFM